MTRCAAPDQDGRIKDATMLALAAAHRQIEPRHHPARTRYIAMAAVADLFPSKDRVCIAILVGFDPGRPAINATSNLRQYRRHGPRWWREEGGESLVDFVKTELREAMKPFNAEGA